MEPDDCAESAPVAVTCHDNAVFLRERLGQVIVFLRETLGQVIVFLRETLGQVIVFLRETLGGQVVVVECTAVCVAATQPESQSLLSR